MTVRDFAIKNGIAKLEGQKVLGFDIEIEISIHKNDLDIDPKRYFRLTSYQGRWIYPNDVIKTTL